MSLWNVERGGAHGRGAPACLQAVYGIYPNRFILNKNHECIFAEARGHLTVQRHGILHLTLESIIDLLEGRTEDKHSDQCPECRGRVEEWRLLRSRLRGNQLTDAPADVLKTAYGIPEPKEQYKDQNKAK